MHSIFSCTIAGEGKQKEHGLGSQCQHFSNVKQSSINFVNISSVEEHMLFLQKFQGSSLMTLGRSRKGPLKPWRITDCLCRVTWDNSEQDGQLFVSIEETVPYLCVSRHSRFNSCSTGSKPFRQNPVAQPYPAQLGWCHQPHSFWEN